tara:strand:- start:220 stop:1161 length:942 start_codon:yes stop_codon:yes gene_type:complete
MNIQSLIETGRLPATTCEEKVWIVSIDPDLAKLLLEYNFANNRAPSKVHINKLAGDMTAGNWSISNDAIAVGNDGRFLNGQHRLHAVVQSNTTQKFIFLYGVDPESAQKFDVGKKRTMAQRISVSGTQIGEKECAVIRNAMNDYEKNYVGTIQYADRKDDDLVREVYSKHYLVLRELRGQQQTGHNFYWAAALKMHAEMLHYSANRNFAHGMAPMERCKLWIDLVNYGYSKDGISVGPAELAAIKLREMKKRKTEENNGRSVDVVFWTTKDAWRFTMSAAYRFMLGEEAKGLTKYKRDPFHNFIDMPNCNFEG